MRLPVELLQSEVRDEAGWRVVTATGQLDVATAPTFRQTLVEAQYGGETRVLLDLEGIEFIDSMGLGVLLGALKRARAHQGQLVVACGRERTLRLFELTGLDQVLRVVAEPGAILDA
jgi:anti-sigma B factor antagonist